MADGGNVSDIDLGSVLGDDEPMADIGSLGSVDSVVGDDAPVVGNAGGNNGCPDGKVRNWLTGYCRRPCKNAQVLDPRAGKLGRCVDQADLDVRGIEDEFRYTPVAVSYLDRRTKTDGSLRPLDNMVDDEQCQPLANGKERQMNTVTGKCKIKCKDYQARNPRTGRCSTREYLKRQKPAADPNGPFLYPHEDDIAHDNHKWVPDGNALMGTRAGPFNEPMRQFILNAEVSVADLKTMRGVHVVSAGGVAVDNLGVQHGQQIRIVGLYSVKQRKKCEGSTFTRMVVSTFYACGFRKSKVYEGFADVTNLLDRSSIADDDFIFLHGIDTDIIREIVYNCAGQKNSRFLLVDGHGVLRILIRTQDENNVGLMQGFNWDEGWGGVEQRAAYATQKDQLFPGHISFSYHVFDEETTDGFVPPNPN